MHYATNYVFQPTGTIFKLAQDIIGTNPLTKFHDELTINVTFTLLTRKNGPPPGCNFHQDQTIHDTFRAKNALPPGGHVFQPTVTLSTLQDIIEINLLTKFHDDQKIIVASRMIKRDQNHFELIQDIIRAKFNVLTKFHEDWTINVASRVLTRKNASPQDIIGTNLLTKFHDDRTINVAF
ncbi:hypothetical protein DPMN_053565 [Dreissena polymorpha]|uniref:Uncharacterized protein n=1 Tax=Dreissena polymorpha TaxID=45954 RepID=A0A9D4CP09_DREPO|nr:hypothetical protein DPMN_053565 [Dreissena polymorpha]